MDEMNDVVGCPCCGGELKFVGHYMMDGISDFFRCIGACRHVFERCGGFPDVVFNDVYEEMFRIRENNVAI